MKGVVPSVKIWLWSLQDGLVECPCGRSQAKHIRPLLEGRCPIYGCSIGDNCKIASVVEIQRGVVLGNNVKVEAFAFIPTGVTVEDVAFIGPHVCFTNDRYPAAAGEGGELLGAGDWEVVPTLVKRSARACYQLKAATPRAGTAKPADYDSCVPIVGFGRSDRRATSSHKARLRRASARGDGAL